MIPRPLLFAFAVALAASPRAEADADPRFSQSLAIAERAETGFNRLSTDQVAVLDALVRRDLSTQSSSRPNDPLPAARFSQRLTADERANAGLTLLTEAELARLDALLERHGTAVMARVLLAPPVFAPTGMRLRPLESYSVPEIHGSISLTYGVGKGGYSEKTGAINLNYEDPVHNFSVMFGYTESHFKGPIPYRDGYLGGPAPFVP